MARMKSQHNTLKYGKGVGKGWIIAQSIIKAQYVINGSGRCGAGHRQYGGRGNGGDRYQHNAQQQQKQVVKKRTLHVTVRGNTGKQSNR